MRNILAGPHFEFSVACSRPNIAATSDDSGQTIAKPASTHPVQFKLFIQWRNDHGRSLVSSLGANPPLSSLPSLPLALEVGPIPSIVLPPLPFSPVLPPLPLEVGPLKSS